MKHRLNQQTTYQQGGFTLLEILVVLGIIALMAVFIVPRAIKSTDRYTLSTEIRAVASALRYTRGQAVVGFTDKAVTFNIDEKTYFVDGEDRTYQLEDGVQLEVFAAESQISVDGSVASIRFYPDGASSGGRVTLAYEENTQAVDVVWLTGQVNILDSVDD